MGITDQLHNEISCIKSALDILSKISQKIDNNEKVNHLDLSRVITFISTYVNECHNKKEEEIIFDQLEELGELHLKHIINDLRETNILSRFYSNLLQKNLRFIKNNNLELSKNFTKIAKKYIELELYQLEQEEKYIIPFCKKKFDQKLKYKIESKYNKIDQDKYGKGIHENFHSAMKKMINNMTSHYKQIQINE